MEDVMNYIMLIDEKYIEAKMNRRSRFGLDWGKWSRNMNLEVREKIESGNHPERALLKCILPYWLTTSELLEAHYKSRIFGDAKKKRLSKQRKDIKNDIMGGNAISELSIRDIAERALQQG